MRRYSKDAYCCDMEPSATGAWVLFEDIAPPAGLEDDIDAALRASQAMNAQLVAALRGLEAMAERYRQPGAPMPDAQKAARAALAYSYREQAMNATLRDRQARVDRLREALRTIAFTKDVAATPLESAHTMQKLACDALAADSVIELTAFSQNLNDARSASST